MKDGGGGAHLLEHAVSNGKQQANVSYSELLDLEEGLLKVSSKRFVLEKACLPDLLYSPVVAAQQVVHRVQRVVRGWLHQPRHEHSIHKIRIQQWSWSIQILMASFIIELLHSMTILGAKRRLSLWQGDATSWCLSWGLCNGCKFCSRGHPPWR